ncbi:unnamed protein product [Linum tenue]|uniref:Uncharacterized protein n=1 Tax=Linum tenue TaxID=586396 RepID=A0AAV0IYC6_9ROSI|nr:unnamed protein product [Linum tenue]
MFMEPTSPFLYATLPPLFPFSPLVVRVILYQGFYCSYVCVGKYLLVVLRVVAPAAAIFVPESGFPLTASFLLQVAVW